MFQSFLNVNTLKIENLNYVPELKSESSMKSFEHKSKSKTLSRKLESPSLLEVTPHGAATPKFNNTGLTLTHWLLGSPALSQPRLIKEWKLKAMTQNHSEICEEISV